METTILVIVIAVAVLAVFVRALDRGNALPPPEPDASAPAADPIEAAIRAGKKIEAIKLYRERTGVGLKEAKDAVEAIERGQSPVPPAAAAAPLVALARAAQVDALVREGKLIEAIKLHRELTGLGLKEAKDAVEQRKRELGL